VNIKKHLSLDRISAIVTWAVVTAICLYLLNKHSDASLTYLAGTFALCCLYLALWIFISTESSKRISMPYRIAGTVLLFATVIAIYFVIPFSFVAIFMVIFSAIMPHLMSINRAFLLSPLWSLPLYLVYRFYWDDNNALLNSFLFWTFNLFALVMVNSSIKEREARLAAEEANRQLIATQSLLNEAVKQGERVRIARNIHDLLGHHLTALTINLQVASRKSALLDTSKNTAAELSAGHTATITEIKSKAEHAHSQANSPSQELTSTIDQCHQLAKLLLSDVREAVSDIRDKSQIDLAASINSIINKLPSLEVDLMLDENIQISDIQVADTILKCIQESITNTLKHAQGKQVSIALKRQSSANNDGQLTLDIINDGRMPKQIRPGNGLLGMQERIAALKGEITFLLDKGRFCAHISIPLARYD